MPKDKYEIRREVTPSGKRVVLSLVKLPADGSDVVYISGLTVDNDADETARTCLELVEVYVDPLAVAYRSGNKWAVEY